MLWGTCWSCVVDILRNSVLLAKAHFAKVVVCTTTNTTTGGSRLMRISLLRISLLRFFKKFHKFALCKFWSILFHYCDFLGKNICLMRIFGYFISLVRFFWLIWLMRILANANFFQNQKLH
jgi:hypothetical protein